MMSTRVSFAGLRSENHVFYHIPLVNTFVVAAGVRNPFAALTVLQSTCNGWLKTTLYLPSVLQTICVHWPQKKNGDKFMISVIIFPKLGRMVCVHVFRLNTMFIDAGEKMAIGS